MFRSLIRTTPDAAALVARLVLGGVMVPHSAQKVVGLWGGMGFQGTLGWMTGPLQIPYPLAVLAIVGEALAVVGLIVGLLGRAAAFGIACVMLVAVITVHLPNGFLMNWTGQKPGEGYEFHVLAAGLALVTMIKGSGALSIDEALTRRWSRRRYGSRF